MIEQRAPRGKTQGIIIRGTRATNDKDRSVHGYRWNSATICGVLSIDRFRLVACLLLNARALSTRSTRKHGEERTGDYRGERCTSRVIHYSREVDVGEGSRLNDEARHARLLSQRELLSKSENFFLFLIRASLLPRSSFEKHTLKRFRVGW